MLLIGYQQDISRKIKQVDSSLAPMSNLTNDRASIKINNSFLVQKSSSSSLYSNFILNLYLVHELNIWLRSPINELNCLFSTIKLTRNANAKVLVEY